MLRWKWKYGDFNKDKEAPVLLRVLPGCGLNGDCCGDPGLKLAGGAEKADPGLLGFEVGVEEGDEFFALGDAGVLLVLGRHLRTGEIAASGR